MCKGAFCGKFNKEGRNANELCYLAQPLKVERKRHKKAEVLPSQSNARGKWPFESKFRAAFKSPTDESNIEIACDLVSRSDVCGWRWHMNGKECMEATLEQL
eukprot:4160228-Amphidinium_carterae.1